MSKLSKMKLGLIVAVASVQVASALQYAVLVCDDLAPYVDQPLPARFRDLFDYPKWFDLCDAKAQPGPTAGCSCLDDGTAYCTEPIGDVSQRCKENCHCEIVTYGEPAIDDSSDDDSFSSEGISAPDYDSDSDPKPPASDDNPR